LPGLYALWFRKSLDERHGDAADLAPQHQGRLAFPLAEAAE
jgi:multidrug efflux pump